MNKHIYTRRRLKTMVLTSALSAICFCAFADGEQTGVWKSVKERAKAEGSGKKALWRELKQLSPVDLLACGEDLYAIEKDRDGGNAIVANALLSYHSEKTSPEATAKAISQILCNSENAGWLKQCVMWIENNNHFLDIPPAAMRQMGTAVAASVRGETGQSMAAREAVLDAAREDTFIMSLPVDSFEAVQIACRDLIAEGASIASSERLRKLASEYLAYSVEGDKHRDEWKKYVNNLRAKAKKNRTIGDDGAQQ